MITRGLEGVVANTTRLSDVIGDKGQLNYAGYDISTLGYHPFLNAAQQSGEMLDILTAARTDHDAPIRQEASGRA